MSRKWPAFLLAIVLLGVPPPVSAPLAAQEGPWELGLRVGGAGHLAGLDEEFLDSNEVEEFRVEPTLGAGAELSYDLVGRPLELRVDYDHLFGVGVESPERPRAVFDDDGRVQWLIASIRYAPGALCGAVCLSGSLGGGWGWYRLEAKRLSGDVLFRFSRPGGNPALRVGLDLSLPGIWEPLRLSVSDYVGDVRTTFDNTDFTPLHLLLVAVEASFPASFTE